MADERRYFIRRESCLAQQLTADDIAAANEAAAGTHTQSTLAGAQPGDYLVTRIGEQPLRLWPRETFEEHYDVDDVDAPDAAADDTTRERVTRRRRR